MNEDLYFIKVLLFKRSLVHNNRCIWYKLQDNCLGKSPKLKRRSFVFNNYYSSSSQAMLKSSLQQWKLSSFRIRSRNQYTTYISYICIYHVCIHISYICKSHILFSYPLSRSRRAETPSPTSNGRSSAHGPLAFLRTRQIITNTNIKCKLSQIQILNANYHIYKYKFQI